MATLSVLHVADAVSSMRALQKLLSDELSDLEGQMQEYFECESPSAHDATKEQDTYFLARAAIYGCMASITDVLGWVNLMAERDAQGNGIVSLQSLPEVPISSIN